MSELQVVRLRGFGNCPLESLATDGTGRQMPGTSPEDLLEIPPIETYCWGLDRLSDYVLASWPEDALRELATTENATVGEVSVWWRKGKRLRVRHKGRSRMVTELSLWCDRQDFEKACKTWGIAQGPTTSDLERTLRLARRLQRARFALHLHGWSPGQAAKRIMAEYGIAESVAADWTPGASHAFYGPRVEAAGWGTWNGPVHAIDVNAAYAWTMSELPDLRALTWGKPQGSGLSRSALDLVHCRWHEPSDAQPWGPLPWRHESGKLCYPLAGEGWYWRLEADSVGSVLRCSPCYERVPGMRPFQPLMDHLLAARHAWSGLPEETLVKAVINACGGLVLRPGTDFHSRTWAGLITARVRTLLRPLLGPSVLSVMTDGILTTAMPEPGWFGPHPGQLRHVGTLSSLSLVAAGIHEGDIDSSPPHSPPVPGERSRQHGAGGPRPSAIRKTRGHSARELPPLDTLIEALWDEGAFAAVEYPTDHYVGLHEAIQSNRMDLWRTTVRSEGVRVIDRTSGRVDPLASVLGSPRGGFARSGLWATSPGPPGSKWEWLAPREVPDGELSHPFDALSQLP